MVKAYVGVGSNIRPKAHIEKALTELTGSVTVTALSTFYWTEPLSAKPQNLYLNGVWQIQVDRSPVSFKDEVLAAIERRLHRIRTTDTYVSRTIDLDLLLYGNLVVQEGTLVLPDPDIYTRPFIALPLLELDPGLVLPDTKIQLSQIAKTMNYRNMKADTGFTKRLRRIFHE
jgi:2-amino-4-hydroxy-6-hydroxymethyldihydropteridine diphosphokinase